ncbi:hypothetical protein PO909_018501 [Leuciscus waleckii]
MTHNPSRLRATFPSPGFCVPLDSPTDRNPPSATGCQALPTGTVLLGRDLGLQSQGVSLDEPSNLKLHRLSCVSALSGLIMNLP